MGSQLSQQGFPFFRHQDAFIASPPTTTVNVDRYLLRRPGHFTVLPQRHRSTPFSALSLSLSTLQEMISHLRLAMNTVLGTRAAISVLARVLSERDWYLGRVLSQFGLVLQYTSFIASLPFSVFFQFIYLDFLFQLTEEYTTNLLISYYLSY